ncbi:hypothetical protein SPRG_00009 [Saprolegnia parasitica CBS 223.65]|uniref:Uncharacterized protein n=1 Tax=Saprolegnia parasitica (strain CBS 223.65) TaxID=695850 RepID=A0A067CXE7_SAPPC|nr:hypothetical protein SPRG_00009 [Saprolegnia parasitica CBS 223.65]KDO35163.1 hypothetical protein SPRG_00009 [Saprolegnia parasitica CBS 223.65]|eukprot:XP_012193515.1 hypothetical protein SPRG_00009 [Saprolegnia parasitica CBS 223.65]
MPAEGTSLPLESFERKMQSLESKHGSAQSLITLDVQDAETPSPQRPSPTTAFASGFGIGLCIMFFAFCARRPDDALRHPCTQWGLAVGMLAAAALLSSGLYYAAQLYFV